MPTTYAIPDGRVAMAATTYTATPGTGATISNAVNGVSFQPDLLWVKNRDNVEQHYWQDSVRGFSPSANVTKMLNSNSIAAESSLAGITCTTTSSGFTVVDSVPASGEFWFTNRTYVGWQWKANGAAVTNTAGSITSQVSANTTAGFSVVTFTTPGGSAQTIGHGLGVAPSFIIIKSRNNSSGWNSYHASLGNTQQINMQTTAAASTSIDWWNNTSPTSSVWTIGANLNISTWNWVAYCFAAVPGYSAFGSYTGNGSTNGPFVYLGLKPRFVMMKRTDTTGSWIVWDTARNTYNQAQNYLLANSSNAEANNGGGAGSWNVDVLSNGFKVRSDSAAAQINASGGTYIYMAFAENPLKYSLAR